MANARKAKAEKSAQLKADKGKVASIPKKEEKSVEELNQEIENIIEND